MNSNDIKIQTEHKQFKYRVAGIVEKDNKILVTKMRNNSFFCFPGGHVELLEDTLSAVKRELDEELFFSFKLKKLLFIHENFFKVNNKDFHELCFYYKCKPIKNGFKFDKINSILNKNLTKNNLFEDNLIWEEIDNGERIFHNFKWINLNDISKYDIRPKEIIESYVKNKNKFVHICSRRCE